MVVVMNNNTIMWTLYFCNLQIYGIATMIATEKRPIRWFYPPYSGPLQQRVEWVIRARGGQKFLPHPKVVRRLIVPYHSPPFCRPILTAAQSDPPSLYATLTTVLREAFEYA